MSWQEQLKDTKRNGGKSPHDLLEHVKTDLVKWGWNPGEGRSTPAPSPMLNLLNNGTSGSIAALLRRQRVKKKHEVASGAMVPEPYTATDNN